METAPVVLSEAVAEWFSRERGITRDTLDAFRVGERSDGAVVYYYPQGIKYRRGIPSGERDFWWESGSKQTLFQSPWGTEDATPTFLVEGETDTMRLWQELKGRVTVFGLPGVTSWKKDWNGLIGSWAEVFVILDNDSSYDVNKVVEEAWVKIKEDVPRAKRIHLPSGIKDVCEFFQAGHTVDDLRRLAERPARSFFTSLDLSSTHVPVPVNWMVDGLIGQGDVTVLFGEPNVGKSWLSLSLALALVQGWDTWLGLKLHNHGRVLYVDEENPEDIVRDRLRKLGMQPEDAENLRYLHDQGIRLDSGGDRLLQEVRNFEPTAVFIDSLTRTHGQDENNAGAIARLFNDGIKPLSRQTGASVFVLHHANKNRDGNSYSRMRGSIDIGAAFDGGLDVRNLGYGYMSVQQFKSRRRLPMAPINVRLLDEDGGTRLVTNVEAPPPL